MLISPTFSQEFWDKEAAHQSKLKVTKLGNEFYVMS